MRAKQDDIDGGIDWSSTLHWDSRSPHYVHAATCALSYMLHMPCFCSPYFAPVRVVGGI